MPDLPTICPRSDGSIVYRLDRPEVCFPSGCRTYLCDVCAPRAVERTMRALAWGAAQPKRARFVTLTEANADPQVRRREYNELVARLRKDGYAWEGAWTTETGSETGMVHIHAMQHGSYVPQEHLQARWGRIVDIRAVKGARGSVVRYMSKSGVAGIARYMSKQAADLRPWLDLNGGRPYHWSSGFLGGVPIKQAVQLAQGDGQRHVWRVTCADDYANLMRAQSH